MSWFIFYSISVVAGLLDRNVIYGVDSTEIANDNKLPSYLIAVYGKKVWFYSYIDYDCGAHRNKRDKFEG